MEILLVEDDRTLAEVLADALRDAGHGVTVLVDGAAALAWLSEDRCDLVVTDVRLPGADGLKLLERARAKDPPADVLVMTGYATVEQAVAAMRGGAVTYLQKPFPVEALLEHVRRVAAVRRMQQDLERLRAADPSADDLGLAGTSALLEDVRTRIRAAARSDATVLIGGESGTGKERAARAIHGVSARASQPFVGVSCAALPESLLEGELFGFRKGAFTGADEDHAGLLEQAGAGTLFLDDVDDLTPGAQGALLRALQEREFLPLGASEPVPLRARVIAATRSDLREAVNAGRFREDLYYRVAVIPLRLPPLREHLEDLPVLLGAFLRARDTAGRFQVAPETLRRLAEHDWPGNVRELENAVERGLALAGQARILRPEHLLPGGPLSPRPLRAQDVPPLRESVRRAEREAIRSALAATGGRRAAAAALLGISRKALWQKAKELGLEGGGAA
ncbi:MAG: sigma-54-dependent Fis family transcriptional regulator [Planctomycetota bacterium]|nr:MAG: sigma-54-dependent Fis family transcriptional regulator [Planctomycetota bacterium]